MIRVTFASATAIVVRAMGVVAIIWVCVLNQVGFTQTVRNWTGPAGGSWFTAANWTPNGAPNETDYLILAAGDAPVTGGVTVFISRGGVIDISSTANVATSVLSVGNVGLGTLAVRGGATLSSAGVRVGEAENSLGLANITGTGTVWSSTGSFLVGSAGQGTVNLTSGAQIATTGTVIVGASASGTGVVNVSGFGSLLDAPFGLQIGTSGNGSLNISNGGTVQNGNTVSVGFASGATGKITIDAGGVLASSSNITLGHQGLGILEILSGGLATTQAGTIGNSTGSGRALIDGVDSLWEVDGILTVGSSGHGELEICDGGRIQSEDGILGRFAGGAGQAIVRTGATWINNNSLKVGDGGTGSLLIEQGGIVESTTGLIGDGAGSVGSVWVDGAESRWEVSADLHVGTQGEGNLLITGGGVVRSAGGSIAHGSELHVRGTGSQYVGTLGGLVTPLDILGRVEIAEGGIAGGRQVTIGAVGSLGYVSVRDEFSRFSARNLTIDNGVVNVDAAGEVTVQQQTTLGPDGALFMGGGTFSTMGLNASAGTLDLHSGTVNVVGGAFESPAGTLELGSSATSDLILNFTNGAVHNTDLLVIADMGKVVVSYTDGATHSSGSGTTIGKEAGSQGTLNVSGAGTQFTPSGYIELARLGNGTLNVWDGATVAAEDFYIGSAAGSHGIFNLWGAGTTLNVIAGNAALELGNGEMHVRDEAVATVGTLWVGANSGSHGVLTVSAGSVLDVTDSLRIGSNLSTAQATVSSGGIVNAENAQVYPGSRLVLDGGTLTFLGDEANVSPNGVFEFKAGTLNVNTSTFFESVSPLLIPSAGVVNVHADIVAAVTSLPGSVINITGNGLEMGRANEFLGVQLGGGLHLGDKQLTLLSAGSAQLGALTTVAGGVLTAPRGIALGTGDVLTGSGQVSGKVAAAIGSLIQADGEDLFLGDITLSDGFATDGNLEVGTHSVELMDSNQAALGALTTLGNTTTAGTLVGSNGLIVDFGRNVEGYGTVDTPNDSLRPTIVNGDIKGDSTTNQITLTGYIKGVGTMDNVVITGTNAPGFSPATVHYGSVEYDGTLEIELAGLLAGNFDKIIHSGVAELGGVLDVSLINGFVPTAGNTFEILTAVGGVSGMFNTELLPTLGSGLEWDVTYSSNNVVLSVVTAGLPGDFDFDGDVDGRDFLVWQRNPSVGDLADWQANYGAGSLPANVAVPEPSAWLLLMLACYGGFRSRIVVTGAKR